MCLIGHQWITEWFACLHEYKWNVEKICYITIIDRPLEKVSGVTLFTRSFALSNTEHYTCMRWRNVQCTPSFALSYTLTEHSAICCYSQFPTTPEDESAVVSQLSQNTPQWLIKSRWDLLWNFWLSAKSIFRKHCNLSLYYLSSSLQKLP